MQQISDNAARFRTRQAFPRAGIRRAAAFCLAVIFVSACDVGAAPQKEITHVVVFWMKRPESAADRAAVVRASKEFKTFPGVVRVQVGSALPIRRQKLEQSFDLCAVFTFASQAALAQFERHPQHSKPSNQS